MSIIVFSLLFYIINMIVLRDKSFSLKGNWKGNPELASALFGNWSEIKISEEVAEDLKNAKFPVNNDFAKLMQIVNTYIPGAGKYRVGGQIQGCSFFMRGYEDLIKNVYDPTHTPIGLRKYEKPRIIIGYIPTSDKCLVVSYLSDTKKYIITKENETFDLIGRGINRLFGGEKFELVLETADFKSILNYIKGITVMYV